MRGGHRRSDCPRRAGVVLPLEVVVVASRRPPMADAHRAGPLSSRCSSSRSARRASTSMLFASAARIMSLERKPRIGDAHRGMVLEHAARALRIVGVERLRNQRQPDHVDAHAGDFPTWSARSCGRVPGAAVRPGRVADVLLHRRAARIGRIVGRLMPSFESEPGSATHREHRAVLGDAALPDSRGTPHPRCRW